MAGVKSVRERDQPNVITGSSRMFIRDEPLLKLLNTDLVYRTFIVSIFCEQIYYTIKFRCLADQCTDGYMKCIGQCSRESI